MSKNSHYDAGGISVIDVIKAKLTPEQYEGFLLGQIIKYSLRLNFKNQKESDAYKLADYTMWLNEQYDPKLKPEAWDEKYEKETLNRKDPENEESSLERLPVHSGSKEEIKQRYYEGRHQP